MSVLHLGSGGGGYREKGGNGGGALKIECVKFINNGQITVNGDNVKYDITGCGSGGSIFIVCDEFIMNSNDPKNNIIHACGGKHKEVHGFGGDGGDGRIRIKSLKNISIIKNCVSCYQIKPQPYIG